MRKQQLKIFLGVLLIGTSSLVSALAQPTAFTYHGRLSASGNAANGDYEINFSVYDAATGGSIKAGPVSAPVTVNNGYFIVILDFGFNPWDGNERWMQIGVRPSGSTADFTPMDQRTRITSTPYAIRAATAGNVSGLRVDNSSFSPNLIGGYSGNSVTPGIAGATIGGGGQSGQPNQVTGYFGTVSGGTGNLAGGDRSTIAGGVLNSNLAPSAVIGGGRLNLSQPSANHSFIGGGENNTNSGDHAVISGGARNYASGSSASIGGGTENNAVGNFAAISGGVNNTAAGASAVGGGSNNDGSGDHSFIGGGSSNTNLSQYGAISGGQLNSANGWYSMLGGGFQNSVQASYGFVGGGSRNNVLAEYAVVPGGSANSALGELSFAAGNRAKAMHQGSFVWADSTQADFASTANDQFLIRATGGMGINKAPDSGKALDVLGTIAADTFTGKFVGDGSGLLNLPGLTLPYSGSINNSSAAFSIVNSGTGPGLYVSSLNSDWHLGSIIGEVPATASGETTALRGINRSPNGYGVYGTHEGDGTGVFGVSYGDGIGIYGQGNGNGAYGIEGRHLGTRNAGVLGASYAGVYGYAPTGNAGRFDGDVEVRGALSVVGGGNVGIGTISPQTKLHVSGPGQTEIGLQSSDSDGRLWTLQSSGTFWDPQLSGTFQIVDRTAQKARLIIYPDGNVSVPVLTITGGADLSEPFQMSSNTIEAGSVVVIDDSNPGQLKLSDHAYDTRVAGIISGANGIKPGISLHQEGLIEGGQNVALSGRVYALADASEAPIKPGDLLTTSSTPGHAMKVTDQTKAQGAIIGKAMSALEKGKGMVLVLVSLQ